LNKFNQCQNLSGRALCAEQKLGKAVLIGLFGMDMYQYWMNLIKWMAEGRTAARVKGV